MIVARLHGAENDIRAALFKQTEGNIGRNRDVCFSRRYLMSLVLLGKDFSRDKYRALFGIHLSLGRRTGVGAAALYAAQTRAWGDL